jgi:hypothetical protein
LEFWPLLEVWPLFEDPVGAGTKGRVTTVVSICVTTGAAEVRNPSVISAIGGLVVGTTCAVVCIVTTSELPVVMVS